MTHEPLFVPALRATMGDWVYYISFMQMKDICDRIAIAEEIHKSARLREFIQRQVTNRATDIADYLLTQKQRFFNAIVVGVYGGDPDWYQLTVRSNQRLDADELPEYIAGSMGILHLSGGEKLFAIDGQHRISGVREALGRAKSDDLSREEICVIVVAHKTNAAGMQRTRRLFTTLNRYAKPVSTMEIIALDEDDVAAIVTRDVVDGSGLMQSDRVSVKKTKAIPRRDDTSITSIVSLYKAHDAYLGRDKKPREWLQYKRRRPADADVARFVGEANELWEAMAKHMRPFRAIVAGKETVAKYRHPAGGHLLFRPVGLEAAVTAILSGMALDQLTLDQAVRRLAKVPMDLAEPPWVGVLWDENGRKMLTREGRQSLASRLLSYLMSCTLPRQVDRDEAVQSLLADYAASMNKAVSEVQLPSPPG
jgi:DNA sulfur modification protein DndB